MATELLRYFPSLNGPDVDQLERLLAEGRRSPTAVIRIIADIEGYTEVVCPLGMVHTDAASLATLLADLYALANGGGFRPDAPLPHDEGMIIIELNPDYCLTPRDRPYIHALLDTELRLRDQIEGVLSGRLKRLSLPAGIPDDEELTSIEEVRPWPDARARMLSGALPGAFLLDAAVSIIRVPDGVLLQLLSDLEAKVMEHGPLVSAAERRPPRLYFKRRVSYGPGADLALGHWGNADRVRAVLDGRLERI